MRPIPGLDRDGKPISLIPVRSGSGEHISNFLTFSVMERILIPSSIGTDCLMFAVAG